MLPEDAGTEDSMETPPLFQRACLFFLVYPELLVILVLVILALVGLIFHG